MSLFTPTIYKRRLQDITVEDLQTLGVRGLFLDVDNTLTTHRSQHLDPAINDWLYRMQAAGISLTVVSNSNPGRVRPFAEKIGLRHISFACKPFPFGFWRAAKRLGLPLTECAAVGDQAFTDIAGAHLAGVKSIQVLPIKMETGKPLMAVKRRLEARILTRAMERREENPAQTAALREDSKYSGGKGKE